MRRISVVLLSLLVVSGVLLAKPRRKSKQTPKPAPTAPATPPATPPPSAPAPAAAPTPATPPPSTPAPDLTPRLPPPAHPATPAGTHCAHCHTVNAWSDVRFAHEKTGFALNGQHRHVPCKACHPVNFKVQVSERCAGCHRDGHSGEFGARCEGCHDEQSWRTSFTVDAHRATNFPLSGAHAMLPCTECHPQVRDRVFARARVTCVSCHQADYDRTGMGAIDHAAAGFNTDCRRCHSPFAFSPARYPDHEHCFKMAAGPHAGIRCLTCHTSPPATNMIGMCTTGNAACTSCHEHSQARTDPLHPGVMGYSYTSLKCYQCHHALGGV